MNKFNKFKIKIMVNKIECYAYTYIYKYVNVLCKSAQKTVYKKISSEYVKPRFLHQDKVNLYIFIYELKKEGKGLKMLRASANKT